MARPSAARPGAARPGAALVLLLAVDDGALADAERVPSRAFLGHWAAHALAAASGTVTRAGDAVGDTTGGMDDGVRHELSVRLVTPDTMRALNREWRGRDAPTNVLSFPADMPALPAELLADAGERTAHAGTAHPHAAHPLGDLVLCPAVVAAEARSQGKAAEAHWAHLVVHGVLHLCGLDHEETGAAEAMEGLEIRLLSLEGIPDPYAAGAPPAHE